jgi:hypothetical protein
MSYSGPDSYRPCGRCGRSISNRGMAQASHQRMHERRGWKVDRCVMCGKTRDGLPVNGKHICMDHSYLEAQAFLAAGTDKEGYQDEQTWLAE